MNKFELFTMIFMALDADWDDTHDEELGQFLSGMNPYLFKEVTSAVPSVFMDFEDVIGNQEITIENSFELAQKYIATVDVNAVQDSFNLLEKEQWMNVCREYLSEPHKGQDC